MKDRIQKIEDWFFEQCDGDWEHRTAVSIRNVDNPGWYVEIDISETHLEDSVFPAFKENMDHELDWIFCRVTDGKFNAGGGPKKLHVILDTFIAWVESELPS